MVMVQSGDTCVISFLIFFPSVILKKIRFYFFLVLLNEMTIEKYKFKGAFFIKL